MSILILGIGNVLLTDEGVGVRAVDELQRKYFFPEEVELLDGGTAGIELLSYISKREHLIIIDAMKGDLPPGSLMRVEGDEVPAVFRTRISPHQLGLSDLLAAAILTGELPAHMVLFGIEPESIDTGLALSETVAAALERLLAAVLEELELLGCTVTPRPIDQSSKIGMWQPALTGRPDAAILQEERRCKAASR